MIEPVTAERQTPPERWEKARLTPVLCAECGHPVCHYDRTVAGALAGGICTRSTCVKDRKTGKPRQVFTYAVVRDV